MNVLRDAAVALGIALDNAQIALFQRYYDLLVEWNRHTNLTRITEPHDVAIQHFLDSLTCLLVFPAPPAARPLRLIDVGSGAGFPALPLKIVRPTLEVTLLESVGKKTRFLEHLVAELGFSGVTVIKARAEELAHDPGHRQRYDLVVARAVAPLATLAEYCLPFLCLHGRFIAQKTAGSGEEIEGARYAIKQLGGRLTETREVALPGLQTARLLVVIDKVAPTPARYPRQAGLPAKSPLGPRD